MPKQLRISAILPIPDDIFDQATALGQAQPVIADLKAKIEELGGTCEHELVTTKPRAPKKV